jgi:hypothetical protein
VKKLTKETEGGAVYQYISCYLMLPPIILISSNLSVDKQGTRLRPVKYDKEFQFSGNFRIVAHAIFFRDS